MIQDIYPKHLQCEYHDYVENSEDTVICISDGKILAGITAEGELVLPKVGQLKAGSEHMQPDFPPHYLFSIDEEHFVLWAISERVELSGMEYLKLSEIRSMEPKYKVLASATAWHLYNWYEDNRFCGRCGKILIHDDKQRMLRCECGNQVFPKIAPAVIVAVTKGDEILVTKYAGREYKKNALVAGFTEIGETAEETVAREVMEEVGLKVKNITYYKSQPWGFSGTLLLGYFCEVLDDTPIVMDENELAIAKWVKREELEEYTEGISLTGEMMNLFKAGN